jgi:hypothetical protein
MAFLPPEQQNQYAPQGATTGAGTSSAPPQTGGSAGAGSGASKAGGEPSSQGTSTQFGSSASKLGDYLSANAPQIGQQAQNVASGLNTQYGQVQSDITNAANQFGQSVQGGYAAPNQDVVNQAVTNPTQFAATPSNVSAFQGQLNDVYSGPTSYESTTPYTNIQGEVQNAVQNAGLLNTQAGLQSYLGQTSGGNQTQASNTLDALLLSGNPAAQQQIQQAAGQFQGLTDQFGNTVTAADQSVQAAQQAAQQAQQYAQGQYGTAVTGFNTNLQNELAAANAANTDYNTNIANLRSQLQSGQLPTGYGVDTGLQSFLTQYMNPSLAPLGGASYNYVNALPSNVNPQVPQLGQVASAQDYATLAALNQLGGTPIQSQLDPTQAALAGTYQTPTIGNLNNQTIAQDILTGAQGVNGQMNSQQYGTYLADLQALENYLGTPGGLGLNKPGPGFPIPVIS